MLRGEYLGEGAFGVVHKGQCRKTGKLVAIKVLARDKTNDDGVRREVEVLRRVGMHRSVAALEGFYETKAPPPPSTRRVPPRRAPLPVPAHAAAG